MTSSKTLIQRKLTVTAFCIVSSVLQGLPVQAQNALVFTSPDKLRDKDVEISMKIQQPFTVVAVGDLIQMVPLSNSNDPDIQHWVKLMQNADITFANKENSIIDHDSFSGPIAHMEAPASIADDWANMGIDIVSKANNHTNDTGDEGIAESFKELTRVNIVHVGADRNEVEARMSRAVTTPKGTAALIGVYAKSSSGQMMGLPFGDIVSVSSSQLSDLKSMRDSIVARRNEIAHPIEVPADLDDEVLVFGVIFKLKTAGAPESKNEAANDLLRRIKEHHKRKGETKTKTNVLKLKTFNGVTRDQLNILREISGDKSDGDTLSAFGVHFKIMPGIGEYYYETDKQNYRNILREIRTGAQFNDFQSVTIHWHQNRYAFQRYSFDHYPSDYQVRFAHDAIDQGADHFFAHGVHTLKGIEIYNGKPIFYGLNNFVFHNQMFRSWRDKGYQSPAALEGPIIGEGEENEMAWNWLQQPANMTALLTSSRYDGGKLVEVRLYPVYLGDIDRVGSQYGTPKKPSKKDAQEILKNIVEYSRPFGTDISIHNGVGIIKID